jgi:hypothetical protein
MLRKAICAVAIIIGVGFGFSAAEEVKGKINKIDDKKVTISVGKKPDIKVNDYEIGKDCKFFKMENKAKVSLAEGLKDDAFKDINPKKGLQATLTVVDGKVTEVIVGKKKAK